MQQRPAGKHAPDTATAHAKPIPARLHKWQLCLCVGHVTYCSSHAQHLMLAERTAPVRACGFGACLLAA